MKKLLIQLDSDKHPSSFDRIVPFDAGVDDVLSYGNVTVEDVPALVQGSFFTRGIPDLKNTAIWIGGSNVPAGEALLAAVQKTFFGPFKVSVMLDSNGCNTTAATAVAKIVKALDVRGQRVVVGAGTGPVGMRAAGMLAGEGAKVVLTSRSLERAKAAADIVAKRFGVEVEGAALSDDASARQVLAGAVALFTCGTAGAQVVSKAVWTSTAGLKLIADINAVPPLGIEGIDMNDNGSEREGRISFGALGIGGRKMKVHRTCIARLFEANDILMDAESVYQVAKELV
ncbi:MAG: methylenetetrahydromethanopterin dehydrogenase [Anaerolineae bacterium]|nr:methylenetetrahydromethanopterin dehydrogenase [Anaerolineales bacterium]MCK6626166.1 NADP-dependent methylenetetrahydromethanopterin/methylenetetrahydrofolate dehydrogenase [Anaerolineae bacterium]MCQ3979154.1 methylenetetrahydromethanopterin dehydrogenase [Anaerolineae bacterium]